MNRARLRMVLLLLAAGPLALPARAEDPPKAPAAGRKAEAEAKRLADEAQRQAEAEAKRKADEAKAALKALSDRADACLKIKVIRSADDVFRAVTRLSAGGDETLPDDQRYLLYAQAGEWEKLRDLVSQYPNDFPARIYGKLLSDLMWANPKPVLLATDVLRIADASPTALDDKQTISIGKLLSYTIAKSESRGELLAALQKGTARLGGDDPARRHAAARVLAAAEFWNEAKLFGLPESDIPELAAGIKPESGDKVAGDDWAPLLGQLRDPSLTAADREAALDKLHLALLQATPATARARLGELLGAAAPPALAWEVVSLVGRKTARGLADFDYAVRHTNIELQAAVMKLLPAGRLSTPPGPTLANLYARNWMGEGYQSLIVVPSWRKATAETRDKYQHVAIEVLLAAAPSAAWLSALEPQLASQVKLMVARLTLLSDNPDRIVPLLAEFSRRDKTAAAELANGYLLKWAQQHDPSFTPEALKQYKLEGHAIVLTRAEQEQSLRQLGALLATLDAPTRDLLDESLAVTAFDLCHSKAEIYTREQIVQVFGPLDQVPASLVVSLLERMRLKLGSNWRNMVVQRDAATRRDEADVFALVNDGYGEADKITSEWLAAHPDDWRATCLAGSLTSDWAEFAYFQGVVADADGGERFATYLRRSAQALDRFRAGAAAYAATIPTTSRADFSLLPYRAWFYGLLGIAHDGDVNLRKGVTRESLQELSQALKSLPGGAGSVHLQMFSTMVADNVKANVIAPQMKYRYLSSAVEITGRNATVYPAAEKVQYYESLLKEIRLRARIDGSDRLRAGGQFGVFVTLVHTADLAREAGGFGKYLQNETRRTVSGKTIVEQPLYRDRFEEALRLALADFFDIKAIVFADPNAGARPMIPDPGLPDDAETDAAADEADWQETPLAYLHLVAKDVTVDRVPPLEIELDFFDRDGKVVIPLPSNPLLVEIAADAPDRRAATEVAITQIVDARELAEHRRLKLDVIATARGLVPDLADLLDLPGLGLAVVNVDDREGLHVSELHSGDDGLYAVSERNWTVELDPTPLLRGTKELVEFRFPEAKSADVALSYRTYQDMDPVAAAAQVTLVEGADAAAIARPLYGLWIAGGLAAVFAISLVAGKLFWKKPQEAAGPPPFVKPREATPFAVASLLHRIRSSPQARLTAGERDELAREIARLERASFATETSPQPAGELESLADRWISVALGTSASAH
ncbi:MAG: hypothetical protein SFU86_18015 [Pirellulaceae bacterium]|nr:hypothetical protein [Pirellulaceae bacterium]